MRVAVVHEWVDAYAGSEQVFEAIAQEFPHADLFALSMKPGVSLALDGRRVETTWLDRARLRDRRAITLPLMIPAWWALGGGEYDLVISSTHAFAHANRLARSGGVHLSYVHSPARYIWSADVDQRGDRPYLRPAKAILQAADVRASRRVTAYAANSSAVAERIARFWNRESVTIHPPVRVEFFGAHAAPPREYVLGVGRWIRYKNLDLVIRAAEIAGIPAKIAGRGPDRDRLLKLAANASVDVEIIDSPDDAALRELYAGARALVFPTVEDFGIVPVEAQAAGTPIVSVQQGGALDTVVDGVTGALVASLDAEALAEGLVSAATMSSQACVSNAARFSRDRFGREIQAWVEKETSHRIV